MAQVVWGEVAGMGEEGGEAAEFAEGDPWGGKATAGLFQELAAAVDHPYAETAGVANSPDKRNASPDKILRDDGIRVEKENVIPRRSSQRLVVGAGKSLIFGVYDPIYLREQGAEQVHATVARMVIHDDDLPVQALEGLSDRVEAKLQKIGHPVIDDYDGDIHGKIDQRITTFLGHGEKLIYLHSSIFLAETPAGKTNERSVGSRPP